MNRLCIYFLLSLSINIYWVLLAANLATIAASSQENVADVSVMKRVSSTSSLSAFGVGGSVYVNVWKVLVRTTRKS